jgi:hypothetical protein
MIADTPEGGIAAGSPGAKEAFWNEWQNYGWLGDQWLDTLRLFNGESGWNAEAQNPSSTAFGVGQFLDTTWETVGETKSSDPVVQARATGKYLAQRQDYGNPSAAWSLWQSRNPHWYDQGGVANGVGLMAKNILAPERTLSPRQTETYDSILPLLESINRIGVESTINNALAMTPASGPSGGPVTYDHSTHLHDTPIMDYSSMLHELDRRGALAIQGTLAGR